MRIRSMAFNKTVMSIGIIALLSFSYAGSSQHSNSPFAINSTLDMLKGVSLKYPRKMICGPLCLYLGARYYGVKDVSIRDIATMSGWDVTSGTTMLGLKKACEGIDLHAEGMRLSVSELTSYLKSGVLGIIETDEHFVLVMERKADKFLTISNELPTWVEMKKLEEAWEGNVLLFSPTTIKPVDKTNAVPICVTLMGAFCLVGVLAVRKKLTFSA